LEYSIGKSSYGNLEDDRGPCSVPLWGRVHPEFSVAIKMVKAAVTLSLMKKGTTLQFNPSFDEDIIECGC